MMEICENCLHYSACLINSEYVPSACTAYKDKTDVAPRAEVAREIFEEIYEDCFDQFGYIDYDALIQLKKKYVEGKTDE